MKYVIIAIIGVLVLFFFKVVNTLIKYRNRVKEAFSTMDVYLKKRWDLIPNLVETTKGYASYESETLESVIKARNTNYDSMSREEKIESNNKVNEGITKLMALVEKYPELKANENFLTLSRDLKQIENDIANSRKYYNGTVREYNNKVETFPNVIVAKIAGFKSQKMFEINSEEKENVKIDM